MSSSVGFSCSAAKRKKVEYVRVADMIKAGKELIPKGWIEIDLGVDGPEICRLCTYHSRLYVESKEDLLRQIVATGAVASPHDHREPA